MTFDAIVAEIAKLSVEERKKLIAIMVDSLTQTHPMRTRNLLEFEGLGERLRDSVNPQDHVNQLRSEWDQHS